MTRNTAREIAAHLSYELSFTDKTVEELLQEPVEGKRLIITDGVRRAGGGRLPVYRSAQRQAGGVYHPPGDRCE